jgi:hypothetical protein
MVVLGGFGSGCNHAHGHGRKGPEVCRAIPYKRIRASPYRQPGRKQVIKQPGDGPGERAVEAFLPDARNVVWKPISE